MANQDEINQFVESIMPFFEQAPPPDDANEVSFPVVNQAVTADMWSQIAVGFGSGVIDRGDYPYRMVNINDTTDTVTIRASLTHEANEAVLDGFFHRQTNDIVLNIPPVSSSTLYRIALQYDPLRTGMPIKLGAYTTLDRSQGKKYIVLWSGTRPPSTVLSQVSWVEHRQRVRPTILVTSRTQLDLIGESDGVLWGTEARTIDTDEVYQFFGNRGNMRWENLTNPPWSDLFLWATRQWAGIGHRPGVRKRAGVVELRGSVQRAPDSSDFQPGQTLQVAQLPEGYRPAYIHRQPVTVSGYGAGTVGTVTVSSDGAVVLEVSRQSGWAMLDGVQIPVG